MLLSAPAARSNLAKFVLPSSLPRTRTSPMSLAWAWLVTPSFSASGRSSAIFASLQYAQCRAERRPSQFLMVGARNEATAGARARLSRLLSRQSSQRSSHAPHPSPHQKCHTPLQLEETAKNVLRLKYVRVALRKGPEARAPPRREVDVTAEVTRTLAVATKGPCRESKVEPVAKRPGGAKCLDPVYSAKALSTRVGEPADRVLSKCAFKDSVSFRSPPLLLRACQPLPSSALPRLTWYLSWFFPVFWIPARPLKNPVH